MWNMFKVSNIISIVDLEQKKNATWEGIVTKFRLKQKLIYITSICYENIPQTSVGYRLQDEHEFDIMVQQIKWTLCNSMTQESFPVNNYLFKVSNRNRKKCEICSICELLQTLNMLHTFSRFSIVDIEKVNVGFFCFSLLVQQGHCEYLTLHITV